MKTINTTKEIIEHIINPKLTSWVKIVDPNSSRNGSIGIAVPSGFTLDHTDYDSKIIKGIKSELEKQRAGGYSYHIRNYLDSFTCTLFFPGDKKLEKQKIAKNDERSARTNYKSYVHFELLMNYNGEGEFHFQKNEKRQVPKKFDMMNHEIKVGDFGVIAYAKDDLRFGNVVKISPAGAVYVRTLKTEHQSYSNEIRLKQGSQFLKISKETYDEALIAKLTFG